MSDATLLLASGGRKPPVDVTAPAKAAVHEFYLVTHGKNAGLASFQAESPLALRRGDTVVLRTLRGLETGTVVGPASVQQSRLIGHGGTLLRRFLEGDVLRLAAQRRKSDRLFQEARRRAALLGGPFEVLDVDLAFDESEADLLVVARPDVDAASLVTALQADFHLEIRLHNLAEETAPPDEAEAGCGKPDCGKQEGGGCSSCSTGGGCATGCGSGNVDLRQYFGQLREKMVEHGRVPLV